MAVIHILAFALILIWRFKNNHKYLHTANVSLIIMAISALFGIFLPIGSLTFLNAGTEATKPVVLSFLLCPPILVAAMKYGCFCIYIDGKYVIKKTLFNTTSVDLKDSGTVIKDANYYIKGTILGVVSKNNKSIMFTAGYIEGNVKQFMSDCKNIHNSD